MSLLPHQQLFLLSVRSELNDSERKMLHVLIEDIQNWDELVRWAISRQAGPFLYKKLSKEHFTISVTAFNDLKQSWLKTLSRNMLLIAHFREITKAFNKDGIEVIAMKGIFLSEWLYTEIGLRQFSDIDLLVKAETGESAILVLENLGYHQSKTKLPEDIHRKLLPAHYPPMVKNGVSVEIHTRLHGSISKYQINLESLWQNSMLKSVHGVEVRVFCTEHLLLTLIQHLDKHLRTGQFQFTGIFDIVNLIDLKWKEIHTEKLLNEAKEWKMDQLLCDYLFLVEKYFRINFPGIKYSSSPQYSELEKIFLRGLTLNKMSSLPPVNNIKTVGYFETKTEKICYLFRMIFPKPSYMKQRYHLKHPVLLLYYYPYRWISQLRTGIVALIKG